MRWIRLVFLFMAVTGSTWLPSQTSITSPPPQTARQALIEMFLGKGENDFVKHLPEEARRALVHKGDSQETNMVLRISAIGRQLVAQGEHIETFDTGSTLLVSEKNNGHEKFEITVERDNLMGDGDEIELSFRYYKDGQLQSLPVVPRFIFTFNQESDIWRLTEITAAAHIPLTDLDYLKGLRKDQDESNQAAAQNRVTTIAMAEHAYAARHPDRGYTCALDTLLTPEPGAMPGEAGAVYDPGQGNEEWSGYRFVISGCEGNPASKYRIMATPLDSDSGLKMFCADESGTIRSLSGTKSSGCLSRGEVVNTVFAPNSSAE